MWEFDAGAQLDGADEVARHAIAFGSRHSIIFPNPLRMPASTHLSSLLGFSHQKPLNSYLEFMTLKSLIAQEMQPKSLATTKTVLSDLLQIKLTIHPSDHF